MSALLRRAFVAVLALAMTMSLTGTALAAPDFRDAPMRTRPNPDVVLHGSGWGHSVGMSQYGAYAQSRAGWGFARILKYYYPGVSIPQQGMPNKIRVGLHSGMDISDVTAMGGPVRWRTCDNGDCTTQIKQQAGTTWRVKLLDSGNYRLSRNGNTKWKGGAGTLLAAAFNPDAEASGTVVRAYHPMHGSRRYKWGKLEYRPSVVRSGAMNLVLQIPSVDLYLRGLGEMPSGWGATGGMAAFRAQVVAARTYAVKAHRGNNGYAHPCFCSLGATPANQAYAGYEKELESTSKYWLRAVAETPGRVTSYGGKLIGSYYSSSHGGRTENIEDSWAYGDQPLPYLRSVADPWSLKAPNGFAFWSQAVSNRSFANFVGSGMARVRRTRILDRTRGGTPIRIGVSGVNSSGGWLGVKRAGYSTRNNKGIVGIDLRNSFAHTGADGGYSQPWLLSQQIRKIGLAPFTDDEGGKHEYPSVFAARSGLLPARDATTYGPGGKVLRADAALALYRLVKLPAATKDYYDDDDGMAQERAINALAKAGIIRGTGDREFDPRHAITRGETATYFRRALGLPKASKDYFTDDNSSPHEPHINAMRRKGLLSGCTATKFCPGRKIERGPMARLLFTTVEAYR